MLSASQWQFVSGTNLGRAEGSANVRRLCDNTIIVLDHELRPLARKVIHPGLKVPGFEVLLTPPNASDETEILALDQTVTVLRFRRRSPVQPGIMPPPASEPPKIFERMDQVAAYQS